MVRVLLAGCELICICGSFFKKLVVFDCRGRDDGERNSLKRILSIFIYHRVLYRFQDIDLETLNEIQDEHGEYFNSPVENPGTTVNDPKRYFPLLKIPDNL